MIPNNSDWCRCETNCPKYHFPLLFHQASPPASILLFTMTQGLHSAAAAGDIAALKRALSLLKADHAARHASHDWTSHQTESSPCVSSINGYNRHGMTALHAASFHGRADCVRILLQHGANPNHPSLAPHYTFPLHLATFRLHKPVIRALLEHGTADPALKDHSGRTILDISRDISIDADSLAKDPDTSSQMTDFITNCIANMRHPAVKRPFTYESRAPSRRPARSNTKTIIECHSDTEDCEMERHGMPTTHALKSSIF